MTAAETDAMRLVPVEPTVEMIDAYFNTVQRFGFHACINASTAWSAMLAAAPAVQPAAGRVSAADIAAVREMISIEYYAGKDAWAQALERILAALAHPPAQGSESGPACQKCGGEIHGWCCQSCDAEFRENDAGKLVFDEDAAPDSDLLKEAVGLLRDLASWFDRPQYDAVWIIRAGEQGADDAVNAARAFLSKVEERG
jgi:hypothetical protein